MAARFARLTENEERSIGIERTLHDILLPLKRSYTAVESVTVYTMHDSMAVGVRQGLSLMPSVGSLPDPVAVFESKDAKGHFSYVFKLDSAARFGLLAASELRQNVGWALTLLDTAGTFSVVTWSIAGATRIKDYRRSRLENGVRSFEVMEGSSEREMFSLRDRDPSTLTRITTQLREGNPMVSSTNFEYIGHIPLIRE